MHGGATATLVDLVGSVAIHTVGAPNTGVSVEINVTYLDSAYADVSMFCALFGCSIFCEHLVVVALLLYMNWIVFVIIAYCLIDKAN